MKHIPNILSFFRILLIPVFAILMLTEQTLYAAIVLLVSGITDSLDGFLARRFGWVSQLGKVLDPAADKLTQVTVCIVFIVKFPEYNVFFILLLIKDLVMLVVGGYLIKKGIKLEGAKWFGKIATLCFYGTMILLSFIPTMSKNIAYILLLITTICAFSSILQYIPVYLAYKKELDNISTEE